MSPNKPRRSKPQSGGRGQQPSGRGGRQPSARRGPQPSTAPTDWRVYRPAIWLAILGIAVALLVNPFWIAAAPLGAAAGVALRIRQRRRRR
jgi:4-hydroxybenzoate polyprenyltransferase